MGLESNSGEVEEFLVKIGMERYTDVFVLNGFEDMDTMFELQEEHLGQLSIPLGHRLKIVKAIKCEALNRGIYVENNVKKENTSSESQSKVTKSSEVSSFPKGGMTDLMADE